MWRVILLTIVLTSVVEAQEKTVFSETFENNSRQWSVGEREDGNVTREIVNNVLRCEMLTDDGWEDSKVLVPLRMDKNFIVRVKVRQLSGAVDNQFGFMYNGSNVSNFYEFTISSDKNARVRRYKEGEKQDVCDERMVAGIKEQGEWNILELRKLNDAMSFYVNDDFVGSYTGSYYLDFGDYLGVLFRWSQVVEYDEITVTEWAYDEINIASGTKPNASPVNLGPGVNAKSDDLIDCISPDGSLLVFSRTGDTRNIGSSEERDVWFSVRQPDGSWGEATNPGAPLNTATHNFGVAITQDLNTLFMQGVYNGDGTSSTSGGVSESHRTTGGWSMPGVIPIEKYQNDGGVVNTHISADGNVLVLSIEDDNSLGDNDLYVCFRQTVGTKSSWTQPVNLGPTINTQGLEMGPFIAADGKTLYFSSNGHPGYGGRDLYVSVRKDDTWTNWSPPKNLGKPINTDEHETFFQVTAKGDSGYYTSTKNSVGESDIWSIALPEGARPEAVTMIRGRVLDAETMQPIGASVVYEELPSGLVVGTARSDSSTGSYRVALGKGKNYGVHAESDGYYPLSETFDLRELEAYSEVQKDLLLTPIRDKVSIRLNNLFFDTGKFDLREESFPELDRLSAFLAANAKIRIELQGHTDNVGNTVSNKKLSQDRVNSVRQYLLSKNVDGSRLVAMGYGEIKPIDSNDTEEGRQRNRRVEFQILQQ